MNKTILLILSFSLFAFLSCETEHKLDQVNWIIGTWVNQTSRGAIYESWVRSDEKTFTAKSYTLTDGDTIVFETIQLVEEANNLFYIPTVKDQNKGEPVRFKAVAIADLSMTFENPEHDFPQRIKYSKISQDSILAVISGKNKGKETQASFPMKKVE